MRSYRFNVLNSLFSNRVEPVAGVVVNTSINRVLNPEVELGYSRLWLNERVILSLCSVFASCFALPFRGILNLLDQTVIPAFHTTYNNYNKLYKLITIAN